MDDRLETLLRELQASLADMAKGVNALYGDGAGRSVMRDTTRHLSTEVFELTRASDRAARAFDQFVGEMATDDRVDLDEEDLIVMGLVSGGPNETEGVEEQKLEASPREIPSLGALKKMRKEELVDLAKDLGLEPGELTVAGLIDLVEDFRPKE